MTQQQERPSLRVRPETRRRRISRGERLQRWISRLAGERPPTWLQLKARISMTGLMLLGGILLMGLRLGYLQVIEGPKLQRQAQAQQQAQLRPFVPRRSIVDRRSIVNQQAELLAVDRQVYSLWAHPKLFNRHTADEVARLLSPILRRPVESLYQRMTAGPRSGIRLERWVPEDIADQLQRLISRELLDGLELVGERQRIYPQKEMAAEVVGYVDLDHRGQAGVEYSQQDRLERTIQPMTVPKDGFGRLLAAEVPEGLLQASETVLQLTLDMRLQRAARQALKAKIAQYEAERGTLIVMDPQTGEILTMASEPTYDPNRYYDYDPKLFRNWPVTDLYEPGSTFKPLNIAIGLETEAFDASTRVYDEGRIRIGPWPIQNNDYGVVGSRGWITVNEVLRVSSNVGMVHLMRKLAPNRFYDSLESLGMNTFSAVDLPFEPRSRLKSRSQFVRVAIEPATTAFGQGFALTPLDLATFLCAIANGGSRVRPHVVRGLVEKDTDALVWQIAKPEPVRIFSEATTRTVQAMMRDVVDYGTGKPARIAGYEVGGKTGTAQKARPNGGGYIPGVRITSFVGFFPAMDPRYVVLAVVDSPKGDDAYGSTVAAPIVRAVLEEIIALEGIPPSSR